MTETHSSRKLKKKPSCKYHEKSNINQDVLFSCDTISHFKFRLEKMLVKKLGLPYARYEIKWTIKLSINMNFS